MAERGQFTIIKYTIYNHLHNKTLLCYIKINVKICLKYFDFVI